MRTAFPLVDAWVAEPPFAVVAPVAFPETLVGERGAVGAEKAYLEPFGGIRDRVSRTRRQPDLDLRVQVPTAL